MTYSDNNISNNNDIPCLDDIVFEFRNKDYGAYQLRKKYVRRGCIGLLVAILTISISLLIPYYRLSHPKSIYIGYGGGYGKEIYISSEHFESLPEPEEQIIIPVQAAPPRPQPKAVLEEVKYAAPEIVDTLPAYYNDFATMDEILANEVDSSLIDYDDDFVFYSDGYDFGLGFGGEGGGYGNGTFLIVEKLPSFQGGDINSFRQWVVKHTTYPEEAIKEKIQGRVVLTFIIETDGSVSNVTVAKSLNPIVDNAVVEVLKSSPRWSPGKQDGKPVRVRYSLGLNFVL